MCGTVKPVKKEGYLVAQRIPEQILQDIIAANDIVDIVGSYTALKKSGSSLVGLCPFHKEKTPSFHVSPDKQVYHCFGCSAGGNVIEFIKNIENLDFIDSVKFLADKAGINVTLTDFSAEDARNFERKKRVLEANVEAARFFRSTLFNEEGASALSYAKKRQLDDKTIATYGLGYAPSGWDGLLKHLTSLGFERDILAEAGLVTVSERGKMYDRFRDRLMFPIIDIRGNVIGFGGRIMSDEKPKYLNSNETIVFNKRNNLFSLNLAKKHSDRELILVEGYMDVISLYKSGIKNAVASLGTALTKEQARLMSRYADKVIICYDTDEAGIQATKRAMEVLDGTGLKVRVLELPDGKDPDDFIKNNGAAKFLEIKKTALTVTAYKINNLRKQYGAADDKLEFVSRSAEILAGNISDIEREMLVTSLSEETGIAASAIGSEINKIAKREVYKEKRGKKPVYEARQLKARENKEAAAERELIALCASEQDVISALGITEDNFLDQTHKKIITLLKQGKSASLIFSELSEEEAKTASKALSTPINYENNIKAAKELLKTMEKERYDRLLKEAADSGDITRLNALIYEHSKTKEGRD